MNFLNGFECVLGLQTTFRKHFSVLWLFNFGIGKTWMISFQWLLVFVTDYLVRVCFESCYWRFKPCVHHLGAPSTPLFRGPIPSHPTYNTAVQPPYQTALLLWEWLIVPFHTPFDLNELIYRLGAPTLQSLTSPSPLLDCFAFILQPFPTWSQLKVDFHSLLKCLSHSGGCSASMGKGILHLWEVCLWLTLERPQPHWHCRLSPTTSVSRGRVLLHQPLQVPHRLLLLLQTPLLLSNLVLYMLPCF